MVMGFDSGGNWFVCRRLRMRNMVRIRNRMRVVYVGLMKVVGRSMFIIMKWKIFC